MKNLLSCIVFLQLFLLSSFAQAANPLLTWTTKASLSQEDTQEINAFITEVESFIPDRMKQTFSNPIQIRFNKIQGQADQISPLSCPEVMSMDDAIKTQEAYRAAADNDRYGKEIRFHDQIQVVAKDGRITMPEAFLQVILAGAENSARYPCEHGNTYKLAQASVIHGVARLFDQKRYLNNSEYEMIKKRNGLCQSTRNSDQKNKKRNRMLWSEEALKCLDLAESTTAVSERVRYRTLAGGWSGRPGAYNTSKFAIWPRAVSPYAYALDVQAHYAYTMEYFLLDPEFACREPNLFEHLSGIFGDPYNAVARGVCRINTTMNVITDVVHESGDREALLEKYDLNPKNVETIYFYRAGAGDDDVSSLFGHSMFRIKGKAGGKLVEACPDEADYGGSCDLIVNHRANPNELQFDNIKGFFGGYPAQLLVKPVYDIQQEYGDTELRHIFNIPLGETHNNKFSPMSENEKNRFIYASLEQYWAYLGNYKFISNNCADEALRLYVNASEHPGLPYTDILTPKQIDEKVLGKLGLVDASVIAGIEEPGLWQKFKEMIFKKSQKNYLEQRQLIEANDWVDESKRFSLYDSISTIIRYQDKKTKKGKPLDAENINVIEKELQTWLKLGAISRDASDICKVNEASATTEAKRAKVKEMIGEIRKKYDDTYQKAKAQNNWEAMYEINQSFYLALYILEKRRAKELGELSVMIAYEIAYPDNGKEMLCTGKKAWKISPERAAYVKTIIDQYADVAAALQPYSKFSVYPGYGIPLENEVTQGTMYHTLANREIVLLKGMIENLKGELGMDYELYRQTRRMRRDLCEDRLTDKLIKRKAPDCTKIFPELYLSDEGAK